MARSSALDPLDKFRFIVTIDGFTKSGFMQCSTPSYSITSKEYPEGGAHLHPKSVVDKMSYAPITLTRGTTKDNSFSKWASQVFDLITNDKTYTEGKEGPALINAALSAIGAGSTDIAKGRKLKSHDSYPFSYRKNVVIEQVNRAGQTVVVYVLYNAYPVTYKPGSDLDATADDSISIESLSLAYEGFEIKYLGVSGLAQEIVTRG